MVPRRMRPEQLVRRLSDAKVVVLGDLVADEYVYGETDRVSREAPVPVVRWESTETSWQALVAGSLVGGLVTALIIQTLATRDGLQGVRLIVVGIGVSAMLASLNTWMLLQVELETAMFASAWGAGSLNGVTAAPVAGAVIAALPVALGAVLLVPRMRQLELGDDLAAATGARPPGARTLALLAGVGLVSAATTIAGPVAFVALAAPQIARRLARTPSLPLGLSALLGGVILLASDLVAQHALPTPLPVGVVTVSVGGVYLLSVIILEIRRRV